MRWLHNSQREILCTVGFIVLNAFVEYVTGLKSSPILSESGRWKVLDNNAADSDSRHPAYYDIEFGDRKNFVTSSYDDKYASNRPSYESKHRLGFNPFRSGSTYSTGDLYERRPTYDTSYAINDYGGHDIETPYDAHQGHRFGLNYIHGPKDLTRSMLLPLAGVALLGIAAALVANPVLLHLGVTTGKRKRRDITSAHNLAYRASLPDKLSS